MTYLLYEHSQCASFDHPNKTEVKIIITLEKSVTMGNLKISKTDVKSTVAGQKAKKTEGNKDGTVIPGCSAKSETRCWD